MQLLAERGHRVFICARDAENVAMTVEQLRGKGLEVDGTACDVRSGEDIKAFVKPVGGKRLDPLDLIRWCERHLAYFQIPRYVEFVDEFPRTPTERIRKDELSTSVASCWDLEHSGYRVKRAP